MIIDKLEYINLYTNLPQKAVSFIQNLDNCIELGRHEICDGVYANVEKYITKSIDKGKFEAHKNYIDIQILLAGTENIYLSSLNNLNVSQPYDFNKDIEFFSNDISSSSFINLDGSNFAVIYPHEAHAPQISVSSPLEVLKVVVKVKVNND